MTYSCEACGLCRWAAEGADPCRPLHLLMRVQLAAYWPVSLLMSTDCRITVGAQGLCQVALRHRQEREVYAKSH